jgi:hypothetical protein
LSKKQHSTYSKVSCVYLQNGGKVMLKIILESWSSNSNFFSKATFGNYKISHQTDSKNDSSLSLFTFVVFPLKCQFFLPRLLIFFLFLSLLQRQNVIYRVLVDFFVLLYLEFSFFPLMLFSVCYYNLIPLFYIKI